MDMSESIESRSNFHCSPHVTKLRCQTKIPEVNQNLFGADEVIENLADEGQYSELGNFQTIIFLK